MQILPPAFGPTASSAVPLGFPSAGRSFSGCPLVAGVGPSSSVSCMGQRALSVPPGVFARLPRGPFSPRGDVTFGSLFAGIGGLDLGLERAGMQCVWQVENDSYAQRVLAKHWPHVRRWDDVRTFPPEPSADWSCDLIAGGFPCQDISNAGRRAGIDGGTLRALERVRQDRSRGSTAIRSRGECASAHSSRAIPSSRRPGRARV